MNGRRTFNLLQISRPLLSQHRLEFRCQLADLWPTHLRRALKHASIEINRAEDGGLCFAAMLEANLSSSSVDRREHRSSNAIKYLARSTATVQAVHRY